MPKKKIEDVTTEEKVTIGEMQIKEAFDILLGYKSEKQNLLANLEMNEDIWKMLHWNYISTPEDNRIKPKSAWLVNTILNKHADAMDNFPTANILPREKSDEDTAKILSQVIPVILEQNGFEQTYSDVEWYKEKMGTGMYGIFWDNSKFNGKGDISIKKIDLANIYWKGGISDIQDSDHVFCVEMVDNKVIKELYGIESQNNSSLPLESNDIYNKLEDINNTEKSAVIDWYYKKKIKVETESGIPYTKTVLHFCKFCNGHVIFATENEKGYDMGWYNHGLYPFVPDVCYPIEHSVTGFGYIDIIKDDQMFVDKLRQAILENAMQNARPRTAVRDDAGLNEEEFLDLSKPIIHFTGNLGEDAFRQITATPLAPIYENVYLNTVQEMKDTSGNTASSQGQASNVTSASGIASLQEASGKLSRDTNLSSYRAFKKVVEMVIELIRQFYTLPRCFRITGDTGKNEYVTLDNQGLMPASQGQAFGVGLGERMPIMDIKVVPQKKSAYSKESQNQTALNLYSMGFFAPNNADASLACLDMMDFDGVEKVREKVQQNQTLLSQVQMLQDMVMRLGAVVDADHGTDIVNQTMAMRQQNSGGVPQRVGTVNDSKGSLSTQAAATARGSASPV